MSTPTKIGFLNGDGSIQAVYLHKSYNVFQILKTYYNNLYDAIDLVFLGSLSRLGSRIDLRPGERGCIQTQTPVDCVLASHRDRGDDLEIETYSFLYEYVVINSSPYWSGIEHIYLFDNAQWKQFKIR